MALEIAFKNPYNAHISKKQGIKLVEIFIKDKRENEAKDIYNKLVEKRILKRSKKIERILDDN